MSHKTVCHFRGFSLYDGSAALFSISLALTDGLLVSLYLVVIETHLSPKVSVTYLARDSNPRR
jgi:hypothetical protein